MVNDFNIDSHYYRNSFMLFLHVKLYSRACIFEYKYAILRFKSFADCFLTIDTIFSVRLYNMVERNISSLPYLVRIHGIEVTNNNLSVLVNLNIIDV